MEGRQEGRGLKMKRQLWIENGSRFRASWPRGLAGGLLLNEPNINVFWKPGISAEIVYIGIML